MKKLNGKISDRIRSGEIPKEALPSRRRRGDMPPDPRDIRTGSGHGLGGGATRKRSAKGAETHDQD